MTWCGPDEDQRRYELVGLLAERPRTAVWRVHQHTSFGVLQGVLKISRPTDDIQRRELFGTWSAQLELLQAYPQPGVVLPQQVFEGLSVDAERRAAGMRDLYMAMNFAPGSTLADRLDGAISPRARAGLFPALGRVAAALDGLHRSEDGKPVIVHGDVSPRNVVVAPNDAAVLVDPGLLGVEGTRTTYEGATRPYAPREVYEGRYLAAGDRHGFGMLVCHALIGRVPPGDRRELADLLLQSPLCGGSPTLVSHVLEMIDERPDRRPPTCGSWLEKVHGVVTSVTAPAGALGNTPFRPPAAGPLGLARRQVRFRLHRWSGSSRDWLRRSAASGVSRVQTAWPGVQAFLEPPRDPQAWKPAGEIMFAGLLTVALLVGAHLWQRPSRVAHEVPLADLTGPVVAARARAALSGYGESVRPVVFRHQPTIIDLELRLESKELPVSAVLVLPPQLKPVTERAGRVSWRDGAAWTPFELLDSAVFLRLEPGQALELQSGQDALAEAVRLPEAERVRLQFTVRGAGEPHEGPVEAMLWLIDDNGRRRAHPLRLFTSREDEIQAPWQQGLYDRIGWDVPLPWVSAWNERTAEWDTWEEVSQGADPRPRLNGDGDLPDWGNPQEVGRTHLPGTDWWLRPVVAVEPGDDLVLHVLLLNRGGKPPRDLPEAQVRLSERWRTPQMTSWDVYAIADEAWPSGVSSGVTFVSREPVHVLPRYDGVRLKRLSQLDRQPPTRGVPMEAERGGDFFLIAQSPNVLPSGEDHAQIVEIPVQVVPAVSYLRPVPQAVPVPADRLRPGSCLRWQGHFGDLDHILALDCSDGHHAEVFAAEPHPAAGAAYPRNIRTDARRICEQRYQAYTGRSYRNREASGETATARWPTPEEWARGDQRVVCYAFAVGFELKRGSVQREDKT